jgi:diacylglycerol kinase family enzyme
MVERLLLLVNQSSGTGYGPELVAPLLRELHAATGWPEELETELVADHSAARAAARRFVGASPLPAAIIVAGGGGTLRAAVEGACDGSVGLPCLDRVRIGALRMGSGNVVARQFGMPVDPLAGMRELATSLRDGRTARCGVIRCRFGTADGGVDVRHAVTMCGLGQFGRTSGDLVRWHRRIGRGRKAITSRLGIERVNKVEYLVSAAGRLASAIVLARRCEAVEVTFGDKVERYRLLAGAVMNLGVGGIPFDPHVTIDEPAAGVLLLPRGGRLRSWRLTPGQRLQLRLLDRESVEFFLDEDPEIAHRWLTLEAAGTVAFVPGASYRVAS